MFVRRKGHLHLLGKMAFVFVRVKRHPCLSWQMSSMFNKAKGGNDWHGKINFAFLKAK